MQGEFRLGVWLAQPSLARVSRGGATVHLRAKVMDLLVFLAQRPDEVVSKDALLNGVWATEFISESALTRVVTELRQALGDEVDHPRILETIPKRGYRLIAPVVWPDGRPTAQATGDNADAGRSGGVRPDIKGPIRGDFGRVLRLCVWQTVSSENSTSLWSERSRSRSARPPTRGRRSRR